MMILDKKNRRREVTLQKEEDDLISIYVLTEPDTFEVRYIGIAEHPLARLRQHCRRPSTGPLKEWIGALKEKNLLPRMFIVETQPRKHARMIEESLILECNRLGARLLNWGDRCTNSNTKDKADELADS